MHIIGVTGGIGSGKSTVAKLLSELGAKVVDADAIARGITEKGEQGYFEIVSYFGPEILQEDGLINRKKLAAIVFNNSEKLKKLNEITHKYVMEKIQRIVEEEQERGITPLLVLDVPIPVKHGFLDTADEIWVVIVEREERIRRIMARNGFIYEEAVERIESQLSDEEYIKIADKVIENSDGPEQLKEKVKQSLGEY